MRGARLEEGVAQFRKRASYNTCNPILKKWSAVKKDLEAYLAANPNDKDNPSLASAMEIRGLMEGEFKEEALEFFKSKIQSDGERIEKMWHPEPRKAMELLDERIEFATHYMAAYSESPLVADQKGLDEKRHAEIQDYIDSGRFEEWKMAQVQVSAPEGKDAQIESKIRSELTALDCEVAIVSMQSTDWGIESNSLGVPLYKYKVAEVGMRQEGKCWWLDGEYRYEYAGGGSYNSTGAFFTRERKEMSCDNLK